MDGSDLGIERYETFSLLVVRKDPPNLMYNWMLILGILLKGRWILAFPCWWWWEVLYEDVAGEILQLKDVHVICQKACFSQRFSKFPIYRKDVPEIMSLTKWITVKSNGHLWYTSGWAEVGRYTGILQFMMQVWGEVVLLDSILYFFSAVFSFGEWLLHRIL